MIKAICKLRTKLNELETKQKEGLKGFIARSIIYLNLFFISSQFFSSYKSLLNQASITVNTGYSSFIIYFIIAIFLYAKRDKLLKAYSYKNKWLQTIGFALLAIILFSTPYTFLIDNFRIHPYVSYFLLYGLGQMALLLAVFNFKFIFKYLQEEVLTLLIIIIGFTSLTIVFEFSWTYFFAPIKAGTNLILSAFVSDFTLENVDGGFIITLGDFSGLVGPACSGIYSLAAFTFIYFSGIIFLRGDKDINKLKAVLYYAAGITALYLLNIIRIVIIMYIGGRYSPELAIELFHEYLSSIFIMILFMVYIYKVIPKIFIDSE